MNNFDLKKFLIENKLTHNSKSQSVNEELGTIALGVAGGILLLKLLKFVAKRILSGIGMNAKLTKEQLHKLVDEIYREALATPDMREPGQGIEMMELKQVRNALKGMIESGEIKTYKDIQDVLKKAAK